MAALMSSTQQYLVYLVSLNKLNALFMKFSTILQKTLIVIFSASFFSLFAQNTTNYQLYLKSGKITPTITSDVNELLKPTSDELNSDVVYRYIQFLMNKKNNNWLRLG